MHIDWFKACTIKKIWAQIYYTTILGNSVEHMLQIYSSYNSVRSKSMKSNMCTDTVMCLLNKKAG